MGMAHHNQERRTSKNTSTHLNSHPSAISDEKEFFPPTTQTTELTEVLFMSEITATQRIENNATTLQANENISSSTTPLHRKDIRKSGSSISSSTQKTSTTSRHSNKSKRLSKKQKSNSNCTSRGSTKRSLERQQKRQQRLAATQVSTTAMFCPVPWMDPDASSLDHRKEQQERSTRTITSTIPPQEYLSYMSRENSECTQTSMVEELSKSPLLTPPSSPIPRESTTPVIPATPPVATQPEKASTTPTPLIPTPSKTTNSTAAPFTAQTQALTPETQASTEVLDPSQSVTSDDSSHSQILARPRALLFEESMRKIEEASKQQQELFHQSQQQQQQQQQHESSEASTSPMILSPLKFVVLAILVALCSTQGSGETNFLPKASLDKPTPVPSLPVIDVQPTPKSLEETALEKAISIEQAALQKAASIEQEALQQAHSIQEAALQQALESALHQAKLINETAIQQAREITKAAVEQAASIEEATIASSKEAAREAALEQASHIQQEALVQAQKIKEAALWEASQQAIQIKEAALQKAKAMEEEAALFLETTLEQAKSIQESIEDQQQLAVDSEDSSSEPEGPNHKPWKVLVQFGASLQGQLSHLKARAGNHREKRKQQREAWNQHRRHTNQRRPKR